MAEALIVKDGLVVRGEAGARRYETADIVVEDRHIIDIGPEKGRDFDGTVVDASNAIVMPGLVNAHLHSNEGFQQGAYDNLPLEVWLGESYPPFGFPVLTERDYYLRTMLAAIESIRAGVTTVQDDYVHPPATPDAMDAAIRAYADAGLRAWVTVDMWDQPLRACLPWGGRADPDGDPRRARGDGRGRRECADRPVRAPVRNAGTATTAGFVSCSRPVDRSAARRSCCAGSRRSRPNATFPSTATLSKPGCRQFMPRRPGA